jgi:hypothetical protein
MLQIQVRVPRDRTRLGVLELIDAGGKTILGPVDCYCKADNASAAKFGNPSRNPERSHGDTPTGGYNAFVSTPPASFGPEYLKKYGPNAFLVMDPTSGQALRAKQNGRHGLLVHGGALNAQGKLRPTFGCVRVFDADMTRLLGLIGGPGTKLKIRVDDMPSP